MKTHKHDYYLDTELIYTNDGEPQPRSTIFLECLDCNFIIRDNEIIKYIEELEKETIL